MSEQFNDKDYGDYFRSLERSLKQENNSSKPIVHRGKNSEKKRRSSSLRLKKSFLVFLVVVLVATVGLIVALSGDKGDSVTASDQLSSEVSDNIETEIKPQTVFEFDSATPDLPSENDAKYGIVIRKKDNKVIAARNAHSKAYPASTTKIMTLLVAAENIKNMNDTFTMTLDITDPLFTAEASVAGFLNGEIINMTDLFYGTILPSGADASTALAIKVAGSEEAFVRLMNKKVKELGLKNTRFDNVTGLYSENNYSTAYDMAVILNAALSNSFCREVLSTYQFTTSKTPEHPEGILLSSTLFNYMYGTEPETATILGGKTGFVNESGYCIASYGKANESGNEYIVVTFGNTGRWPAFYGQIELYKALAK